MIQLNLNKNNVQGLRLSEQFNNGQTEAAEDDFQPDDPQAFIIPEASFLTVKWSKFPLQQFNCDC